MGISSDGERYALIFKLSEGDAGPRFLAVSETRLLNWKGRDWIVLARDSDMPDIQIDDARREDEKGRR